MRIQAANTDNDQLRLEQLKQLFREVVSEGQVDIDVLRDLLDLRVIEGTSRLALALPARSRAK